MCVSIYDIFDQVMIKKSLGNNLDSGCKTIVKAENFKMLKKMRKTWLVVLELIFLLMSLTSCGNKNPSVYTLDAMEQVEIKSGMQSYISLIYKNTLLLANYHEVDDTPCIDERIFERIDFDE